VKCEYGLILYKVIGFDEVKKKVKMVRLNVEYGQGPMRDLFPPLHTKNAIFSTMEVPDHYMKNEGKPITAKITARWSNSTIENTNKLAVVKPSSFVKMVFDAIVEGDERVLEAISLEEIGSWIHGGDVTRNPFVTGASR
jgi:hypothetical protein